MTQQKSRTKTFHFFSTMALGVELVLIIGLVARLITVPRLLPSSVAHAAGTIYVNTTVDEYDEPPNSTCSLREAIQSINTSSSFGGCDNPGNAADTIQLQAATYTLTLSISQTNPPFDNSEGSLQPEKSMIIRGAGSGQTTITTTIPLYWGLFRISLSKPLAANTDIAIEGMTIQGGSYGGITAHQWREDSTLTLTDVVIENNEGTLAGGGLVWHGHEDEGGSLNLNNVTICDNRAISGGGMHIGFGDVNLNNVTLCNNQASRLGGGIFIVSGNVTLNNVTVNGNWAGDLGGGIYVSQYMDASTTLQMTNVTIHDNEAQTSGGGLYLDYLAFWPGTDLGAMLTNVTLANNRAVNGSGGNIYNNQATLNLKNTIVANGSNNNCAGNPTPNITSLGYNLASDRTCGLSGTGDFVDSNPRLAASLADNGGSTQTLALLSSSPAIDQGSCSGTTTDQRGKRRPVDVPDIANADDGCDIGAYEVQILQSIISYLPIILKNSSY